MFDCIITAAGIDYLTLTTTSELTSKDQYDYFLPILAEDLQAGFKPVKAGSHGYVGVRTRHAFLADNGTRQLLEVSGERAEQTFNFAREQDHCARLDIQVTVRISPGAVNRWLDAAERVAQAHPAVRGRKPVVHSLHGADGNETVYIGSKKSDVLIRLYDKFRESGKEHYKDCVRLEVQLRNKPATAVWRECGQRALAQRFLLQVLFFYLNRAGITTDWIAADWSYVRPPKDTNTKEDTFLGWCVTQIAPALKRYSAENAWCKAFYVLFRECLTPHEMSCILRWSEMNYGD